MTLPMAMRQQTFGTMPTMKLQEHCPGLLVVTAAEHCVCERIDWVGIWPGSMLPGPASEMGSNMNGTDLHGLEKINRLRPPLDNEKKKRRNQGALSSDLFTCTYPQHLLYIYPAVRVSPADSLITQLHSFVFLQQLRIISITNRKHEGLNSSRYPPPGHGRSCQALFPGSRSRSSWCSARRGQVHHQDEDRCRRCFRHLRHQLHYC